MSRRNSSSVYDLAGDFITISCQTTTDCLAGASLNAFELMQQHSSPGEFKTS